MALQFNLTGAFVAGSDGTFTVDFTKIKAAVRESGEPFMIEATGDFGRAKTVLAAELGVLRSTLEQAIEKWRTSRPT